MIIYTQVKYVLQENNTLAWKHLKNIGKMEILQEDLENEKIWIFSIKISINANYLKTLIYLKLNIQ